MPTTPPTIAAAPAVPQRNVRATFGTLVDAFNTWKANSVAQFAAVAANVFNNAVEAFNSATAASNAATTATDAAAAAALTAGATVWVSGQSVTQYAAKISPINGQTYRRVTATGSGTTDPSLDTTNYIPLFTLVRSFLSADQTVTANGSLTIAHGLGAVPKIVLPFTRVTASGLIYPMNPYITDNGGLTVTFDATNIYVAYAGVVNTSAANNTIVFFVRAFL